MINDTMESRKNEPNSRSLPPLVEGKIHGYLRLVIDEIVWSRRNPGDVTVLTSWWGELDSAQFRPADIKRGDNRRESDITEIYTVRTNLKLFQEYLKNCETVELVVISEKNHQVVGTARFADVCNLLNEKPHSQYIPILNDNGNRIGDVHITLKLTSVQKQSRSPSRKLENKVSPREAHRTQSFDGETIKTPFPYKNDVPVAIKNAKQSENVYRSILKERHFDPASEEWKSFPGVNDKLVAQVVARAQRLRGAIIKEARDEDPLALSESSTMDSFRSDISANNEANLYEYFLGKKMSDRRERKALDALRTTSPTLSLMDLAAETIRTCREEKSFPIRTEDKNCAVDKAEDEIFVPKHSAVRAREISPLDYVDSLRIAVESLTLSSAGYRRVRSSCLSRGDGIPLSVTYFVQYDSSFGNRKRFNRKIINESKPVKLCSKKQVGQVIYFNHEAVYDLPKTYINMDIPLKFKIFNRHLNQRTPTELGIGSIYVGDAARSRALSSTQRLAIVNKGIKIGELKVTVELGCDKIHFGKQFVEAVTSAKENIPVLEVSSLSSLETPRYRTATGSESKESVKPSTSSGAKPGNSWSVNNADRTERQESCRQMDPQDDERVVDREDPRRERDERVLLHGLIYIAEGKDLSSFSTYLICKGFWREDRSASRVCVETNNPVYNFHQLVPLVHGQDLLERTRNNCIVVEVYSRNDNGTADELLGISKLSIHRLYVAYKDPQVLPHLLASKYPVISVDEWVSIIHPVSGRPCGQIHALVALGTADQIALLEMTRGLRDSDVATRNVRDSSRIPEEYTRTTSSNTMQPRFSQNHENPSIYERSNRDYVDRHDNPDNTEERNVKSISCQTEITTVKDFKGNNVEDGVTRDNPQSHVLNAIVDRLAQALNVPKSSADQAAQTEMDYRARNSSEMANLHGIEPLNLNPSTNNSFIGDSSSSSSSNGDADSQRDHFLPSREIYRSVGVGAEYDDPINLGPSTSYANTNSIAVSNGFDAVQTATNLPQRQNERSNSCYDDEMPQKNCSVKLTNSITAERLDSDNSDTENSSFRAVVEIDCALHLPRVEKIDGQTVEPCTYVTFQKARNHSKTQYGCYIVTHLFPFSCSPKWDWRCDTRLSNDLLDNEEKRLILKVWRLVDPETSMEINLERDIVIGFSAIDVSVLTVGFPVVSGWFHVMDFTGKCNGQIKVSVTPLDNIAAFGKAACQTNTTRLPDFDHSNFSSPYPADNTRNPGEAHDSRRETVRDIPTNRSQVDHEPILDIGLNLGDASMSFLSLSLKQKLTELDEIKKRLQTRLLDVTNTAFDDDFENDFDSPIAEDDNANNGNTEDSRKVLRDMESWQPNEQTVNTNLVDRAKMTNGNRSRDLDGIENQRAAYSSNCASTEANFTDTGYSTGSNVQSCRANGNRYPENTDNRYRSALSSQENMTNGYETASMYGEGGNLSNGHYPGQSSNQQNRTSVLNVRNYRTDDSELRDYRGSGELSKNVEIDNRSNDSIEDHPIRGTRVHISHLLDKLTTQLTTIPSSTTDQPMKHNIVDLITSLRRNNNHFSNDTKCNREINVRTVPTQTEMNYSRDTPLTQLPNNSTETRGNLFSTDNNDEAKDNETCSRARRRDQRVSTAIRQELATDEADDNIECDELSTHLISTNVRHMDFQNSINPLLYQHLIPDFRTNVNGPGANNLPNISIDQCTPEVQAVENLDTRYTENFTTTINNGLSRLRNLLDNDNPSRRDPGCSANSQNDEGFRVTPSGISDNIDGNIDVTVILKACNEDLMASNSVESTTTISLDNDLQNATDNDDNSSLNSTETSVSGVARQAPDGGNPIEESSVSVVVKSQDGSQDSSSTS